LFWTRTQIDVLGQCYILRALCCLTGLFILSALFQEHWGNFGQITFSMLSVNDPHRS